MQYHQQLKLPLTPQVTRDLQYLPPHLLQNKGKTEPPPHHAVHRHLNFNDSPLPAVHSNDDVEEDFPTAPLDDSAWSEEPIADRDFCIHIY